jgi:hypothetical protein
MTKAIEHLDRDAQLLLQAGKARLHFRRCHRLVGDLWTPGESKEKPAVVLITLQSVSARGERVVAPDDHGPVGPCRIVPPLERYDVDPRESLGRIRRLELTLMTELH